MSTRLLPRFSRLWKMLRRVYRERKASNQEVFTEIYRKNLWGDPESVSGCGSRMDFTAELRRTLPDLLRRYRIASLLDAPCGDFNWMSQVALPVQEYIGLDIVAELIARNRLRYEKPNRRFLIADITSDLLPQADLILCRLCLVHLPFKKIQSALRQFKHSGARYLLTTTYAACQENLDVETGGFRRINFTLPPFNFPEPLESLADSCSSVRKTAHTYLGLWRLGDLPLESC